MNSSCAVLFLILAVTASTAAQSTYNEDEDYYFRAGTGYPFVSYSNDLQDDIDALTDAGASRSLIATLDVGVYWPLGARNTLLGVSMTGVPDFYQHDDWQATINFMQIGAGIQYFPTSNIGDGIFLRCDPGMVLQWSDITISDGTQRLRIESESRSGFGILFGGGYAIPLSPGTRLTIDVHAAYRSVDPFNALATHIGLGLLW